MKTCADCGLQESEEEDIQPCDDCGILLCYEHRRDFPNADGTKDIYCVPCVKKRNEAYLASRKDNT